MKITKNQGRLYWLNSLEFRIPGARFLDVNAKFIDPAGKFPTTFPPESLVKQRMGQFGISITDEIVLYSQNADNRFTARTWWVLKSYGFDKVVILNGGLLKWVSAGYPTEEGPIPEDCEAEFQGELKDPSPHLITFDQVRAVENDTENTFIVDTRPIGFYEGTSPLKVTTAINGHIPNAISHPAMSLVNEDGTFKSAEELREKYGEHMDKLVITYCNAGNQASLGAFGFTEAGFKNVKMYDGSWFEYGTFINPDYKPE